MTSETKAALVGVLVGLMLLGLVALRLRVIH